MSREYSEYNIKRFCAGGPKYYIVCRKYLMFFILGNMQSVSDQRTRILKGA